MPRAQRNPCVFICYAVISHQSDMRKNSKTIVQSPTIRLTPDTNQLGGGVEEERLKISPPPLWRLEETMSGEESSTERDRKLQPDSTPDPPPPTNRQF